MANTFKLAFLIQYHYSFYIYLLLITLILTAVLIVLVVIHYRQLKKAAGNSYNAFPESHLQLNALLNSLNDIIFEFDENKVCLNVWYNDRKERVVDPKQTVGKKLIDVLGPEKSLKFDNALDYVIKYRKSTSIEYISDYGTGIWYIAKLTPVFDREGNYLSLI